MPHNPLLDVSPSNPEIPEDLSRDSKQNEISVYLWKLLLSYGKEDDKWFLHPFPIHFEDNASKRSYKVTRGRTIKTLEGISKLHTFDQWTNQDFQGADTLIGYFCTWSKDWAIMPAPKWKNEPWHAFGAALRIDEETALPEAELVIWDPVSKERLSKNRNIDSDALIDIQQRLIRHCAKSWDITRVWLGGENIVKEEEEIDGVHGNVGEENCLKATGLWIHECLRNFQGTLPRSSKDLEALNYRAVSIVEQ